MPLLCLPLESVVVLMSELDPESFVVSVTPEPVQVRASSRFVAPLSPQPRKGVKVVASKSSKMLYVTQRDPRFVLDPARSVFSIGSNKGPNSVEDFIPDHPVAIDTSGHVTGARRI